MKDSRAYFELMTTRQLVFDLVRVELDSAIAEHGVQENATIYEQHGFMVEEDLETIQAINDDKLEHALTENIQSIAMRIKLHHIIQKEIDRRRNNESE